MATVSGFAHTLRQNEIGQPADRYVEMIQAASGQIADILDDLGLAARIEAGRFSPNLAEADTLELAEAAAGLVGEKVAAGGTGAAVQVDREPTERALAALARCALRHGGLEQVELTADGASVAISPVLPNVVPIILGEDLKDLGAAAAGRLVESLGGSLAIEGERLVVRLPAPLAIRQPRISTTLNTILAGRPAARRWGRMGRRRRADRGPGPESLALLLLGLDPARGAVVLGRSAGRRRVREVAVRGRRPVHPPAAGCRAGRQRRRGRLERDAVLADAGWARSGGRSRRRRRRWAEHRPRRDGLRREREPCDRRRAGRDDQVDVRRADQRAGRYRGPDGWPGREDLRRFRCRRPRRRMPSHLRASSHGATPEIPSFCEYGQLGAEIVFGVGEALRRVRRGS